MKMTPIHTQLIDRLHAQVASEIRERAKRRDVAADMQFNRRPNATPGFHYFELAG